MLKVLFSRPYAVMIIVDDNVNASIDGETTEKANSFNYPASNTNSSSSRLEGTISRMGRAKKDVLEHGTMWTVS